MLSWLLFLLFASQAVADKGMCAMYGNCGKKSVFGKSIPCPELVPASKLDPAATDTLAAICGADFASQSHFCCSADQVAALELNLKRVESLISLCPACRTNFYDFFCQMTCLPDQATFAKVTSTSKAVDTGKDVVSSISVFTDPDYAKKFFDSCKNLKFAATNGYAMDLIGGGAHNYQDFLKFLGDEKPLLGGLPFQIDFKFEVPKKLPFVLSSGDMKACDDPQFRCACSDCPSSCPVLEEIADPHDTCRLAGFPCFTVWAAAAWAILVLIVGAFHIRLARRKKGELERLDEILRSDLVAEEEQAWASARLAVMNLLETGFSNLGRFCSTRPFVTLSSSLIVCAILTLGLYNLSWETNPTKLWVSPSEPALQNQRYFESSFGEFFRIEQIIVSSKNGGPVLSWDTVQWWFEKEQELQTLEQDGEIIDYESICFKPTGETCAIDSFAQYFNGDIRYLTLENWAREIAACAESPVNCLPSFQQPLKKNLLFALDAVLDSPAFVVTLLVNSNSGDKTHVATTESYERALRDWVFKIRSEQPELQISFSTESSLEEELNQSTNTDVRIVAISYILMFIYASVALGGKLPTNFSRASFISTRFALGLVGVGLIIISVAAAAGLCATMGIKSTLIIAEVIPFLVLAIGVDNIFLVVHELDQQDQSLPVEERVSSAVKSIGPSCFISAVLQTSMFLLASSIQMPAVRNFALYSACAVAINFVLQMTAFLAFLSLDQKRMDEGRVDVLWISGPEEHGTISLDHVDLSFTPWIEDSYGPWLFRRRGPIIGAALTALFVALAAIPYVQLGLDQRLALPLSSYLVEYFDSVYSFLNVGPPMLVVVKDLDVTQRANQQQLCGKFSACANFSIPNILDQEAKRSGVSTIAEPASNWLDDFLTWLNPSLDQCCRVKKGTEGKEFCPASAPERLCEPCYLHHTPPYNTSMEGLPIGKEFMHFFQKWINEPSDPCPLGGKAPYSAAVNYSKSGIQSSYLRTSHTPLRSQADFIAAYESSLRIVDEIKRHTPGEIEVFAYLPFYVFFVQYVGIVSQTFKLVVAALAIIFAVSALLLGLVRLAVILCGTVTLIMVFMGGFMAVLGISLNAVSLVNLVICMGLAVEFTIHITRAYLKEEENERFVNSMAVIPPECRRAYRALVRVGGLVLGGITITKCIGIAVLAFTRSKIFEVYYFRMWLSLVVVAAVHALVILPVALSFWGLPKGSVH